MRGRTSKTSVAVTVQVATNGYVIAVGEDASRCIPADRYVARNSTELIALVAGFLNELDAPE